jgi:hypothetical protein
MNRERPELTGIILRGVIVLVVALLVGWAAASFVDRGMGAHATAPGRLAAMMAGLFAGGAAGSVTLLIVAFGGRKR